MDIDRESPIPPWRQLADILRAQIESGEIERRIPGERTLEQEYGLSYKTARKATAYLREQGVIVTSPGMGSYVMRGED